MTPAAALTREELGALLWLAFEWIVTTAPRLAGEDQAAQRQLGRRLAYLALEEAVEPGDTVPGGRLLRGRAAREFFDGVLDGLARVRPALTDEADPAITELSAILAEQRALGEWPE
jgi:hypothetical protein